MDFSVGVMMWVPLNLCIFEMGIFLEVALQGILQEILQLLIEIMVFFALAHPYFNSEALEGVPVALLHEPHSSYVLIDSWDRPSANAENEGFPSLLENSWLLDTSDLNSELSTILILLVLPRGVDTIFEYHDRSDLIG